MNRLHITTRHLVTATLLVAASIVPACQCYPDPERILQPPAAVPDPATKVAGAFLDAKTQELVTAELTVTARNVVGQPVGGLRDTSGKAVSSLTVSDGVLAFSVAESASLPLRLTLVAQAAGYLSTSARLEIAKKGSYEFVVPMVKLSAPPAGVQVAQGALGSADATGTLPLAASLSTAGLGSVGAYTELTLPVGTKLTTASGAPLTGQLTGTVVNFNNLDASSLGAFPGGFEVNVPPAAGATRRDGVFISAGFTAIQIRDGAGNEAATFSQPVDVTLGIPAATVDPTSGVAIAEGAAVPFWSYDEATAVWSNEGAVTVAEDGSGALFAAASTTHLSYFNLDWHLSGSQVCSLGRTVELTGNPDGLYLALELTTATGYLKRYPAYGEGAGSVSLRNAPATLPMTITARYEGQVVGTTTVDDLCTGAAIPLAVTLPAATPASLSVQVERVCEQDDAQRTGLAAAVVLVGSFGKVLNGYSGSGQVTFDGLAAGDDFEVHAFGYDGTKFPKKDVKVVAGENVAAFAAEVECQVVSGATGGNP